LENINHLDLTGMPLNKSVVDTIVTLPQLVHLGIRETGISDAALAGLAISPHLGSLEIDCTQATEQGIAGLARCPVLESLRIIDADDGCVQQLPQLSRLKHLLLQGDQVTAISLPALQQLPALQLLTLLDTQFADVELDQLRQSHPGGIVQQMDSKKFEAAWQ
jgi:hypothetical protein